MRHWVPGRHLSLVLSEPPVTVPPPGGGTTPVKYVPRRTKISGIKSPGRRIKGRVGGATPCKAGRRVVVKKGSKTIGSSRSKRNGSFNVKTKKHKKGKLTVSVRKRTVGNTICRATTKRVPGRN